jgi:predicted kinase
VRQLRAVLGDLGTAAWAAAEMRRMGAELARQVWLNLQLAERPAACSQVLGRAAERKGFDGVSIWSVVT